MVVLCHRVMFEHYAELVLSPHVHVGIGALSVMHAVRIPHRFVRLPGAKQRFVACKLVESLVVAQFDGSSFRVLLCLADIFGDTAPLNMYSPIAGWAQTICRYTQGEHSDRGP
eukprot:12038-Amphidinium_carterae.1